MALGRPVHAPEAADGTTRSSVALNVAPGSAVHGGLAQMFTPPRFSSPAHCRVAPLLVNRARLPRVAERPDGAPNAAGEQARRLPMDSGSTGWKSARLPAVADQEPRNTSVHSLQPAPRWGEMQCR